MELRQLSAVLAFALLPSMGAAQAPEPAGAAEAEAPSETLALRFDWPEGLEARVTLTRDRQRGDRPGSESNSVSYSTRTSAVDGQLKIEHADVEMAQISDGAAGNAAAQALTQLLPAFLVSPEGGFAGLADFEAYQANVKQLLMALAGDKLNTEQAQQLVARLVSKPNLESRSGEYWSWLVAAWVGAELELDFEYSYSEPAPVPMFPDKEVILNHTIWVDDFADCSRNGQVQRCAVLVMESESDPELTKALVNEIVQEVMKAGQKQGPQLSSLSIKNRVAVTTEPDTLVPHRYVVTKVSSGSVTQAGKEQAFEQVETQTYEYSYE